VTSPYGPLVLIVNPRAGRGTVGARLSAIRGALERNGLEHRVVTTEGPGHATAAASEALRQGERFLVAVGGDGTVHEVVNGMLEDDRPIVFPPDPTDPTFEDQWTAGPGLTANVQQLQIS